MIQIHKPLHPIITENEEIHIHSFRKNTPNELLWNTKRTIRKKKTNSKELFP